MRAETSSEPVEVQNAYGTLAGTLELPARCGAVPVVLIASGSGAQDRDGNSGESKPGIYRLLAEALGDAGIASLRFDDIAVGGSADAWNGREQEYVYELEVDALMRWTERLRTDPRFSHVWGAGHSEGSLTLMLSAEKAPLDGFISLAGAGRPIGELLREQLAPQLTKAQRQILDDVLAKLARGELAGPQEPPLDVLLREATQPYFISWMKYDPAAEVAKLAIPVLVVQGELDLQVSVKDADILLANAKQGTSERVSDMGHMLRAVTARSAAAQKASYAEPNIPLHPRVVESVPAFLQALP